MLFRSKKDSKPAAKPASGSLLGKLGDFKIKLPARKKGADDAGND